MLYCQVINRNMEISRWRVRDYVDDCVLGSHVAVVQGDLLGQTFVVARAELIMSRTSVFSSGNPAQNRFHMEFPRDGPRWFCRLRRRQCKVLRASRISQIRACR